MSVYGNNLSSILENTFLNEAYVGKTPILEEISKKFQSIIDAGSEGYYKNMSRDKRIIEINRLFEKQFGMEIFSLRIENSEIINAYTMPAAVRLEVATKYTDFYDLVECNPSRGYYFKKDNNLCVVVYMYTGLLYSGLTGEQVTAVILHEIGHNFADALYDEIYLKNRELVLEYRNGIVLAIIISAILIPVGLGIPMMYNTLSNLKTLSNKSQTKEARKNDSKNGKTGGLKAIIVGAKNKATDYLSYIAELSYRLADYTGIKIPDPLKKGKKEYNEYKNSIQRINEVFADKFAVMYGYGPELSVGLGMMNDSLSRANREIQNSNNETNKEKNLKYEDIERQACIYDEHPRLIQRMNSGINSLERELKKDDLDPKYRKMIEQQLKEIKEAVKQYTTTMDKLSKNDNARRLYNDYINNKLPDAVEEEIEEKIEEALDKGFNDYKKKNKK